MDLQEQLELLSDRAMPGIERESVGSWTMRASHGATGRANSTWAPRSSPGSMSTNDSLASAVDTVEAWYQQRSLLPIFQIFENSNSGLSAELDRRNYPQLPGGLVMTGSIEQVRAESEPYRVVPRACRCWPEPPADFVSLVDNNDRLAEMTQTELSQSFVLVLDDAEDSLGGGIATLDGDWLGLFAMRTVPGARRQGIATVVLNELVRRGIEAGARTVWLQVAPDNDPAIALYEGLGMTVVHRYHYRRLNG